MRLYYSVPYWGGWGWPGHVWPGYHWPGPYAPGPSYSFYYYGPAYGYLPPQPVYGPPGVVTSTGGVVYIEREAVAGTAAPTPPAPAAAASAAAPAAAPPPAAQWWYLCDSPRGAYPYVRHCPGGWERVPAVPPDATR